MKTYITFVLYRISFNIEKMELNVLPNSIQIALLPCNLPAAGSIEMWIFFFKIQMWNKESSLYFMNNNLKINYIAKHLKRITETVENI